MNFLKNLPSTETTAQESEILLPYDYQDKGNEVKDGLEIGFDSNKNRWEMLYDADNACWWRIKYKGRDEKRELVEESDKTFETKEACEADAKAHGMNKGFFKGLSGSTLRTRVLDGRGENRIQTYRTTSLGFDDDVTVRAIC